MKNIILKSIIISLGINIMFLIINLVSYFSANRLFLAIKLSGGEWMGYSGFGIMMNKTYPMSTVDKAVMGKTWLSIDPFSFLIPFIVIFALTFVILKIKQKRK